MISLYIGFNNLINVALFISMAAAIGLWVYRCINKKSRINLFVLCLVNIAILIFWSRFNGLNPDEAEHLHCSWMVSQGLVPFTGFWQHHSPLLWVMMAPFMKIMPQSTLVFDISRLLGACFFVIIGAIGWSISRKVWGKEARWQVYLLLLSSGAVIGEYLWFRPDIFNVLFLLAGVRVSLDIPGKRMRASFIAGMSFGLAMAFAPKQFLLCFIPAVIIIREGHNQWLRKVLCWGAGLLIGFLPLLWYLINFNIVSDYIQWVLLFNEENMVFSVFLPLVNLFAGSWAVKILIERQQVSRDFGVFALLSSIVLSTASSLLGLGLLNSGYYLACWFVLIAAAGASLPLWEIGQMIGSNLARASLTGMFLALCIIPNVYLVILHESGFFSDNKKAISRILEYSRTDQCVVLLPNHPVFVKDATRLYSSWQFYFVNRHKNVREDVKLYMIARRIMEVRPAVVMCRFKKRDFILELYQKKLITALEYKELIAFLIANYTQQTIGEEVYYVRNDRL
jgi:hypothetical protein